MSKQLKNVIYSALLAGIALALFFLEFPLFPAVGFLKMDFSDIPALMGALLLGPWWGVLIELIKNLLELLIKGMGSQMGFGNLMNFAVGVAFILPFSLIFRRGQRSGRGEAPQIAASATGTFSIMAVGLGMNLLVMPLYFRYFVGAEMPMSAILGVIGYATALNAIKGVMLSVSALLYKPLKKAIKA
jgi:riboflavin transporter FmnP